MVILGGGAGFSQLRMFSKKGEHGRSPPMIEFANFEPALKVFLKPIENTRI
jgi:hypothetical protein